MHQNIDLEAFGASTLGRSGGRGIGACAEAEVEILYSEDVPGTPRQMRSRSSIRSNGPRSTTRRMVRVTRHLSLCGARGFCDALSSHSSLVTRQCPTDEFRRPNRRPGQAPCVTPSEAGSGSLKGTAGIKLFGHPREDSGTCAWRRFEQLTH